MTSFSRAARATPIAIVAAAAAVAALGSCGPDRACIKWSAAKGTCPSAEQAQALFTSECDHIQTVDGPGEPTDPGLCCYDVTNRGSGSDYCSVPPPGTGPGGPITASGATASVSASTGSGPCETAGTCSGCVACAESGNCADEKLTCDANPSCATLRKCVESCAAGDQTCVDNCISGHQQGVGDLNTLYVCLFCQECFSICGGSMLGCPM